jgi:hypothetical protein
MPTKRIGDLPKVGAVVVTRTCPSNEHDPPTQMVYEPGVYEHEYPACHAKRTFVIYHGVTFNGG